MSDLTPSAAADHVLAIVAAAAQARLPGLLAAKDALEAEIAAGATPSITDGLQTRLSDVLEQIRIAESHSQGHSPDMDAISRAIATPDAPFNPYGPGPTPTLSVVFERGVRTQ